MTVTDWNECGPGKPPVPNNGPDNDTPPVVIVGPLNPDTGTRWRAGERDCWLGSRRLTSVA